MDRVTRRLSRLDHDASSPEKSGPDISALGTSGAIGGAIGGVIGVTAAATALALVLSLQGCATDSARHQQPPSPSASGSGLGADLDRSPNVPVASPMGRLTPGPTPGLTPGTPGTTASGRALTAVVPEARSANEPWHFGQIEGQVVVTANYRLHTTMTDERMLRELAVLMEEALGHYRTALGELPPPRAPMRSFVFERRSEWADHTRELLGSSAGPYLGLGRGGYTTGAESVLFNIGREDTFTIAVHEGWHQYTQQVFRDQLPVWLEEGIATYMEGNRFRRGSERPAFMPWRNFERYGELRDTVRTGRLVPLAELIDGSPQRFLERGRGSLLSYYAQVWALVHFLLEGEDGAHRAGLLQAVSDAAHGQLVGRLAESDAVPRGAARRLVNRGQHGRLLVEEYISRDLEELSRQYEAFVRQIVSSGSASRIWRGQSPLE